MDRRNTWGEDRVYFIDETGKLRRLPAAWTSVVTPAVFETMSAGRSHFCTGDLLDLVALIGRLKSARKSTRTKQPRVSSK